MRLDHLLSKGPDWVLASGLFLFVGVLVVCFCLVVGGAAGVLWGGLGVVGALWCRRPFWLVLVSGLPLWWLGVGVVGASCVWVVAWLWVVACVWGGMLSGFWGSAPWWPGSCLALLCVGLGGGVGGLVVNCIVDASIFDSLPVCCTRVCVRVVDGLCFVCFFERSVDALASGADEGRGGLR